MARRNIESAIQREIVKYLRTNYPEIEIRYNKNENKKNKLEAIIDKKMGQAVAGTPDLTLFLNQRHLTHILELELKTLAGKLNPNQVKWHDNFTPTTNRKAAVAYGYDDAKRIIDAWVTVVLFPH